MEEELRAVRQERDELKLSKDTIDGESATQISALHVQLQSSNKRTSELQALINDLTKEREKLKMEIDKFQKQSIEVYLIALKDHLHIIQLISYFGCFCMCRCIKTEADFKLVMLYLMTELKITYFRDFA